MSEFKRSKNSPLLEKIQSRTKYDPFHTVLVAFSQGLPHCLLLRGFPRDADTRTATIRARGVLLYLAKFNSFRRNIMTSICKIEQAPECCIGIRLGYLKEGKIRGIGGW
jgi:hypothetical protein